MSQIIPFWKRTPHKVQYRGKKWVTHPRVTLCETDKIPVTYGADKWAEVSHTRIITARKLARRLIAKTTACNLRLHASEYHINRTHIEMRNSHELYLFDVPPSLSIILERYKTSKHAMPNEDHRSTHECLDSNTIKKGLSMRYFAAGCSLDNARICWTSCSKTKPVNGWQCLRYN